MKNLREKLTGRIPLRRKLLLLTMAVLLVLGLVAVLVFISLYNDIFLPISVNKNLELGQEIARMETANMDRGVVFLEQLSRDSGILGMNSTVLGDTLVDRLQGNPYFQGISVIGLDGKMQAIYPFAPTLIGQSFLFRNYVKTVLATDKPYISQSFQAGSGQYVTVIAVPIQRGGAVAGVLTGAMHLDQPDNLLNILNSFEHTGMIFILDRGGRIISSPRPQLLGRLVGQGLGVSPDALRTAGGSAKSLAFSYLGRPYLAKTAVIEPMGWVVLVAEGEDELTAPILTGILAVIGVTILGIVMAGVAGGMLADRYLTVPVLKATKVARELAEGNFHSRLEVRGGKDEMTELGQAINTMAANIEGLTATLEETVRDTVNLLGRVVEANDQYTELHSERLENLAGRVGQRLNMPPASLRILRFAAALHDVGKVGVRWDILHKNGPLTDEEWEEIKKHPELGEKIVRGISNMGEVARIIGQHQERYDGTGYPRGISGETILLEARIVAVADAFDAMVSDRPYRSRLPWREAVRNLREGAGRQLDPRIVEIFLQALQEDGLSEVSWESMRREGGAGNGPD